MSIRFLAVVVALIAAGPALAWTPSAADAAALQGGQAVVEAASAQQNAVSIRGAIDVAAPARVVWAVMTDCARVPRMITNVASCRVVERDPGGRSLVRETVTRPAFFIPAMRNLVREDYEPYHLIRFARVGGDLRIEQGQWTLQPLDGGAATRVIYENLLGADIPAPAPLVRAGLRRDTIKVLENLRRECLHPGG